MELLLASRNLLATPFFPLKKLFHCKIYACEDGVDTLVQQGYSRRAMKMVRSAAVFLVLLTGALRADKNSLDPTALRLPDHPAPAVAAPLPAIPDADLSDPDANQDEPGAEPEAFLHPKESPQVAAAENLLLKKNEKKEDDNRDWLVRGYEQQLQARAHAEGDPVDETNLYAELSGDKDLAKAAGISPTDYTSMVANVDLHTGESSNKSDALRPDPALNAGTPTAPAQAPFFKPFLGPAATDETATVASPFAAPSPISAPFAAPLSFGSRSTPDTTGTTSDDLSEPANNTANPSDMDIPGMTAAESSPATRESMDLTTEDLLPGEVAPPERPHHDLSLELPVASNADRLQKLQDAALSLPGQPEQAPKKPEAPSISETPPQPPSDTQDMVHDPTGIRIRVGDPFDILH
jgi:hypothetical protein